MANPFAKYAQPEPGTQAAESPNPFAKYAQPSQAATVDPQRQAEDEVRREMAMKPEEYETYIRDKVHAGGLYRPQPTSSNLTGDQIMDATGLQDEIVGAGQFVRRLVTGDKSIIDRKAWSDASQAYSDAAERIRAERRVARENNGWAGTAGEFVGGLGSTAVGRIPAALNAARGAGATRAAQATAFGDAVGRTAAPIAARPLANRLATAAGAGAATGGALGFTTGEGGVENRLLNAGVGAAVGGTLGPAISEVAVPAVARTVGGVNSALRYASGAIRSARNPERAAIENVADRMVAAGVDPAAVRAAVSPPPSPQLAGRNTPAGRPFNEEDMAEIISRSLRGDTAAQIGADYGIHPGTVTRYVNTYRANNPTPMNIIDVSKEIAGEGGAAPVARLGRAAYSLAGDESGDAAQRLIGRQETQSGRTSNIIQRSVAGGDFEATRTAGQQRLRNEADQAYRQFYAEPDLAINELADLMDDPLFREANIMAQRQARVEVIRRNQAAARAGRPVEPVPNIDPDAQVFSPETLDLIQRQLRIASEGRASNPNAARHAGNLREVFLDRIEDHYPTFRGIRRNYATGVGEFGEEGALEAGANLTTQLGANSREALRGFDAYTPAQQELFRLGFARRLMDMAANPQVGGTVANRFNTPAVREIVEQLYPRGNRQLFDQGQRLLVDLRRESITTRTKNDVLSGARSAELGSDMGRMMEGAKTAADALSGRPWKLLENLSTRLTTQLGRRGAREVLDVLTQTEPAQLLHTLNRLARAATNTQQRQAYVTAIRGLRQMNLPGVSAQVGVNSGRRHPN